MTDRNFQIFSSPGFLIGLLLLLANDLVFKAQFHNGFTGKLSDFAGVFVFSLFWMALFPRRKAFICVSTALLFLFWKSAYSQVVIEGWNSLPFFGINRTVDYTDLAALLVVPLSYYYSDTASSIHLSPRFIHAIAIVSLVAFTATSFAHKATFKNEYPFQLSKKEFVERMSRLPTMEVSNFFWRGDEYEINFKHCDTRGNISVVERAGGTVITLKEMVNRCSTKPSDDAQRELFEREFIDKMRLEPVTKSAAIHSIWSSPPPAASPTPSALRPPDLIENAKTYLNQTVEVEILEPLYGPAKVEDLLRAEYGQLEIRMPEGLGATLSLVPASFKETDPNRYRQKFDRVIQPPIRVKGQFLRDEQMTKRKSSPVYVIRVSSLEPMDLGQPEKVPSLDAIKSDPAKWDRKLVLYEGIYRTGFEQSALDEIWLEIKSDTEYINKVNVGPKGHRVRVTGILFARPNGHYGHLGGSRFQITAAKIEYLEPVH